MLAAPSSTVIKLQQALAKGTIKELRGHKEKVHTVGWNCNGERLASGSVDKTARVWNTDRISNPKDAIELKGHSGDVDQLAWDPTDPDRLATASVDRTVRLWDIRVPSKPRHVIQTNGENINVCWSPDGRYVAVGNKEDLITIIDPRGGTDSKNRNYIFHTIQKDVEVRTVQILEFPSFKLVHTIHAHTANCFCIEFDPKGSWPVRTISFSYDGELIASGSEDLMIDISHVESGDHVHTITCTAATNTVAWHPHRYILAYAGDEVNSRTPEGNLRLFTVF
ncbi:hypothetical protein HK101_003911 [Irineochytrium annulatum]|nr:hypothetical protein HK101_003911 [Irineochytrium annulatum]